MTSNCQKCGIELTEENWYASQQKKNYYICKRCSNEKGRKSAIKSERRKGVQPFDENPNCAQYLGVHVAERVLSHVFKDVKRMPMNNPGYDVICNQDKLVDVKSSCTQGGGGWSFRIRQNTVADFFLCIAFDNRENLNPLHVWMIPGSTVNHLTGLSISESTHHKWDEYRLDTSKIAECCDSIRTARGEIPPTSVRPYVPAHNSSRLSILSYLKAGLRPVKIAAKMGIAMSTLQYHLTTMVKQGLIRKVGYGVWEVLEEPTTEKKTPRGLSRVDLTDTPKPREIPREPRGPPREISQASLTRFTQDAVRGHAFRTRFQIPRGLRNWNNEKRTQYLTDNSIPFKHLKIGGEGQRILVKDRKVWLLNKAIIIYDTASYFAEAALEAKQTALATHLGIIKHIERLLHTSFLIGSDYKFKVSSQHYALIYNALAKQYNEAGEKLEVRTAKGAWLIIDDSYGMNELETVHPKTGMTDNDKVKDWFDGLKEIPATRGAPKYTPGFVLGMLAGIQQNQQIITENQLAYATNIESHITSIQDLGTGVRDMNKLLKEARR